MRPPVRTLEVRWMVPGAVPEAVSAWFDALGPAVGTEARTDHYLPPTDASLGVKWRQGPDGAVVETKRRTAVGARLRTGQAEARVEAWAKWSLPTPAGAEPPHGWVAVDKQRRQRRDASPVAGATLELTAVRVGDEAWWTVAVEATAARAADRRRALETAAARWLADAPPLGGGDATGYPAWLLARAG